MTRSCPCEVSWCVGPDLPGDICAHCLETWTNETAQTDDLDRSGGKK